MKKLMLFAAVAAFGLSNMNAQEVHFGVKGGLNIANVNGDFGYSDYSYDTNTKSKVGFHIGGLAEIMLSEKFAIQPELLFSNQGYKSESNGGSYNEETTVNLNYVNLPIMAKFFPIEGLSIEAGPQVGFLVAAKTKYEYTDSDFPEDNESVESTSKDPYKGFDFGLNVGAGYKLDSGLYFQARYNLGLAKVDDDGYYTDGFEGDLGLFSFSRKNRVIQLSVGFMF